MRRIYTTQQAAEYLGTHRHRVYMLAKFGLLRGSRWGKNRGWRFTGQALDDFIDWAEGKDLGTIDQIRHWAKKKGTGDLVKEPGPNE